jgi:hypothetical protein
LVAHNVLKTFKALCCRLFQSGPLTRLSYQSNKGGNIEMPDRKEDQNKGDRESGGKEAGGRQGNEQKGSQQTGGRQGSQTGGTQKGGNR